MLNSTYVAPPRYLCTKEAARFLACQHGRSKSIELMAQALSIERLAVA